MPTTFFSQLMMISSQFSLQNYLSNDNYLQRGGPCHGGGGDTTLQTHQELPGTSARYTVQDHSFCHL